MAITAITNNKCISVPIMWKTRPNAQKMSSITAKIYSVFRPAFKCIAIADIKAHSVIQLSDGFPAFPVQII